MVIISVEFCTISGVSSVETCFSASGYPFSSKAVLEPTDIIFPLSKTPAELTFIFIFLSLYILFRIYSAIGLRQMLPVQTINTEGVL